MDVLVGLWRRCNDLECLVLRKVKRRAAFTSLLPRASMTRVVLDACWINDNLCAEIGANAPNLEVFYVEDDWADDDFKHPMAPTVVTDLTDEGVLALAAHQRNLKTITFIGYVSEISGCLILCLAYLFMIFQGSPVVEVSKHPHSEPCWMRTPSAQL
jgi:hypothetical protein